MSEPGTSPRQWLGLALLVAVAGVVMTVVVAVVIGFLATCGCTTV